MLTEQTTRTPSTQPRTLLVYGGIFLHYYWVFPVLHELRKICKISKIWDFVAYQTSSVRGGVVQPYTLQTM